MDFSYLISEERIKKAYEDGDFDNLPGYGKPLKFDELTNVPKDLRMAYRLLENAGYTSEEGALRQEMMTIENLLKKCNEDSEREKLSRELNQKLLDYNRMLSKRGIKTNSAVFKNYEQKIEKKWFK